MVVGMRSNRTSIFMFDYLFIIIGHKLCTPDKYIYTHTYICTYVCMHIYIYVCIYMSFLTKGWSQFLHIWSNYIRENVT